MHDRAARIVLLIIALAFGLCLALLAQEGLREGGDSGVYLDAASELGAGRGLPDKAPSYAGYVIFLLAALKLGSAGVGVLQAGIAASACWPLYRLGSRLGGPVAGLVAAALYVVNVEGLRFATYVLPEALYIPAVAWAAWLVVDAADRGGIARYAGAGAACVAAATIRPNGLAIAFVAGLYLTVRASVDRTVRVVTAGAVVALFVAAALLLPTGFRQAVAREQDDASFRRGQVMWRNPDFQITMPQRPPSAGPAGALRYAAAHPLATAELVGARIGLELAHVRPYYSTAHNVYVIALLLPVYAGALLTIARRRNHIVVFGLALIAVHLALVGLTFADYDGRWLLHVLPLISVLAAVGWVELIHGSSAREAPAPAASSPVRGPSPAGPRR